MTNRQHLIDVSNSFSKPDFSVFSSEELVILHDLYLKKYQELCREGKFGLTNIISEYRFEVKQLLKTKPL